MSISEDFVARLFDPVRIEEERRRQSDPNFIAERIAFLDRVAAAWGPGTEAPVELQPPHMSVNEALAVTMATGRQHEIKRPIEQFIEVQPWLQGWVLKKWKMADYIGRRLGMAE